MKRCLLACALVLLGSAFAWAESDMTADRMERFQATETLAPPPMTAEMICNTQVYGRQLEPPAEACFRAVATERGWSAGEIDRWVPFAITADNGILYGESEHCPMRRAGDVEDDDCRIIRCADGRAPQRVNQIGEPYCHVGEDTGFGQATCILWGPVGSRCTDPNLFDTKPGPGGFLCLDHGYCSPHDILRSPYHSMRASVVLIIEESGSRPWCYNARAVRYHRCNVIAPDR